MDRAGWRTKVKERLERLNRERPERYEVARHIADQMADLDLSEPLIVELGTGSGFLTGAVLRRVANFKLLGFDASEEQLQWARDQLGTLADELKSEARIDLHAADLNGKQWLEVLEAQDAAGNVDVVVSLQTIHDLGRAGEQKRLYRSVYALLRSGGRFINADLLFNPDRPHPRRLTADHHVSLLKEAGFDPVRCTLRSGEFACFLATRSQPPLRS